MDFQSLDPKLLVLTATVSSFVLSCFSSPPYNFPLFLFGIYVAENTDSQSLQTFTGLVGGSLVLDIVWMFRNEQNGLTVFLTVMQLLLKIIIFFTFAMAVRQRGGQFGGLGLGGNDISGPTVWSMPGGFTSEGRDASYQTIGEERIETSRSKPQVPPSMPIAAPAAAAALAQPSSYQNV